jgi:hypothetical protein
MMEPIEIPDDPKRAAEELALPRPYKQIQYRQVAPFEGERLRKKAALARAIMSETAAPRGLTTVRTAVEGDPTNTLTKDSARYLLQEDFRGLEPVESGPHSQAGADVYAVYDPAGPEVLALLCRLYKTLRRYEVSETTVKEMIIKNYGVDPAHGSKIFDTAIRVPRYGDFLLFDRQPQIQPFDSGKFGP